MRRGGALHDRPVTSVRPHPRAERNAEETIDAISESPLSATELFDLRLSVAEYQLERQELPAAVRAALLRDWRYWAWFGRVWHTNNLRIHAEWTAEFPPDFRMERGDYVAYQRELFADAYVNAVTLELVCRGLPDDVVDVEELSRGLHTTNK